jgi:hypothetical protein
MQNSGAKRLTLYVQALETRGPTQRISARFQVIILTACKELLPKIRGSIKHFMFLPGLNN